MIPRCIHVELHSRCYGAGSLIVGWRTDIKVLTSVEKMFKVDQESKILPLTSFTPLSKLPKIITGGIYRTDITRIPS